MSTAVAEAPQPTNVAKPDPKAVLASKGVPAEGLTIERNGANWKFIPAVFKQKDSTKPPRFGLVPEKPKSWTPELQSTWNTFVGPDQLALISHARVRQMSSNWFESSINENTGEFSAQEFSKAVDTFSLRGETIAALKDELDELQDDLISCAQDTTVSAADRQKRFTEIAARMAEIKETMEVKSRKKDTSAEE